MQYRYGRTSSVIRPKGSGTVTRDRRRVVWKAGRINSQVRWRAEKALGRPLPEGVVVFSFCMHEDELETLVVCPDRKYLNLLKRRLREVMGERDGREDL